MKKKYLVTGALIMSMVVLGACGNKSDKTETTETKTEMTEATKETESKDVAKQGEVVFKGSLKQNAVVEGDNVSLYIIGAEGVKDPDGISKGLVDGVIINTTKDLIEGKINEEDLTEGKMVEVTMKSPSAMTSSLPPQVAGNAIVSVKLLDEKVTDQKDNVVFTGTLKGETTMAEGQMSCHVSDINAETDPDELVKGFGQDGVILNLGEEQVEDDFKVENFVEGDKVEVTVKGDAVTTRSLPPQIPGMSIVSMKKL